MAPARRRCTETIGLFDEPGWEPADPVKRFAPATVRAATIAGTISRAVAAALRECELDRDEVAARMSAWLGEDVSKNMLDAYASLAREEHRINVPRLLALVHATGDMRLLQVLAEPFGCSVVEDRWLPWIEFGQYSEVSEEIAKRREAARRRIRRGA